MRSSILVACVAVAVFLVPTSTMAQTSELYLGSYSTTDTYVVQGGVIVRQFNRSSAVDGTGRVPDSRVFLPLMWESLLQLLAACARVLDRPL